MGDGGVPRAGDRPAGVGWRGPVVLAVLVAAVLLTGSWVVGHLMSEPDDSRSTDLVDASADGTGTTGAAPPDRVRGFSCVSVVDPDEDDDHCGRAAADSARRAELTPAQRASAQLAAEAVQRALPSAWPHACRSDTGACARWGPDARSGSTDLTVFRIAFRRAGLVRAEVRLASGEDPAPHGTVLYAVPSGAACVVGWTRGVGGGGSYSVEGRLPDGRCLD